MKRKKVWNIESQGGPPEMISPFGDNPICSKYYAF